MKPQTPEITVVVCTYNRAALLRETLASLSALETDGQFTFEILVVNNASTDDTNAVIDEMARSATVTLRSVFEPVAGVSAARNRGVGEARGEWIAFFDDDQVAHPCWLKELRAIAHEKSARCVGGANRLRLQDPARLSGLSPAARGLLSETIGKDVPRPYTRKWAPGTGNLMVHRDVFAEVGTFDLSFGGGGEDTDLYRRIWAANIPAWYTPHAISYHIVPSYRLTDDYLRWKALRNGDQLARGCVERSGRWACCLSAVARCGQALAVHLPRMLWGKIRQDDLAVHHSRCLLWRTEGYVRQALRKLAPRLFAQRRFFSSLELRSEQQLFATPASTAYSKSTVQTAQEASA